VELPVTTDTIITAARQKRASLKGLPVVAQNFKIVVIGKG
jgi:hypothetical protein